MLLTSFINQHHLHMCVYSCMFVHLADQQLQRPDITVVPRTATYFVPSLYLIRMGHNDVLAIPWQMQRFDWQDNQHANHMIWTFIPIIIIIIIIITTTITILFKKFILFFVCFVNKNVIIWLFLIHLYIADWHCKGVYYGWSLLDRLEGFSIIKWYVAMYTFPSHASVLVFAGLWNVFRRFCFFPDVLLSCSIRGELYRL